MPAKQDYEGSTADNLNAGITTLNFNNNRATAAKIIEEGNYLNAGITTLNCAITWRPIPQRLSPSYL
jgi:hypothetical protein